MADERIEYFRKGYKKGLEEAFNEIMRDASGVSSINELKMIIKAKSGTISGRVDAQVDLLKNELGIRDEKPSSSGNGELIEGCAYLVKERRPEISYALFKYLIEMGHPGLCISRHSREVIVRKYKLQVEFSHIKLGAISSEGNILSSALAAGDSVLSTSNLSKLYEKISGFLSENPGSVILMDGTVEYLTTENEFSKVLKFIQKINDRVGSSSSYLFIGISPDALKKQEMAALERETADTFSEEDA